MICPAAATLGFRTRENHGAEGEKDFHPVIPGLKRAVRPRSPNRYPNQAFGRDHFTQQNEA